MTTFHTFLNSSKTKEVLSRKPGEEGFSLIELVVVVAVLAILAAIAIPSFTAIQDNAAQAAAKNTIATIAKECAVRRANMEAGTATYIFNVPNLNSYTITPTSAAGTGSCAGTAAKTIIATGVATNTMIPSIINYNVDTGLKSCTAGSSDSGYKFCSSSGRW